MGFWRRRTDVAPVPEGRPELHLEEVIAQVQGELMAAEAARIEAGRPSLFAVTGLTLEVNVVATWTATANGGVTVLNVVTVGGQASYERQQVHKVTLTLTVPPADQPAPRPARTEEPPAAQLTSFPVYDWPSGELPRGERPLREDEDGS
jgi:hypothetical protein